MIKLTAPRLAGLALLCATSALTHPALARQVGGTVQQPLPLPSPAVIPGAGSTGVGAGGSAPSNVAVPASDAADRGQSPSPAANPPIGPAPPNATPTPGQAQAQAASEPVTVAGPNRTGVVKRIIIKGNERIESSTVVAYLPISPGDSVDPAKLDLALKTLARTDLFSDERIDLDPATGDLTVTVVENPIINQVVFEGNSALNDEKLRDEISIHPRGIFTKAHVASDVQKIVELYRRSGRIAATVTPKIVNLPQKRVDLVFEINEGPKTGIQRINFLGNKAFSDNTLRDVVVTKQSRWYRFFSSNDNYDPDRIEYDREQLRKYYSNRGYYDFRVTSASAELLPNQRDFDLTYVVDEGPKYHFGKLDVKTDLKRLNANFLKALLPIKEGQLYQADKIEGAVDQLTYLAGAAGFAFVDIRPRTTADPKTKAINVTFDVREGPRVYIERIDIVGNTTTQDYVIRRELRVAEGDAYNRVLVDRSKNEVKRLNFFKTVDIDQLPGSAPDKTVLRLKVQEQPTGELSLGAGYSSVDKLLLDVGVSQHNFRGTGQDLSLRASIGSLETRIDARYSQPRFLGRNLVAGVDLFSYKYDFEQYAGYDSDSTGVGLRLGFPINVNTYLQTRYQIHADRVDVDGADCSSGTVSVTVCDQIGDSLTSLVGYTLTTDHRNDPIHPSRGFTASLSQDLAGIGGDVKYLKTTVQGSIYHGFSPSYVLEVSGDAGYIQPYGGDNVRINDRFFKGGNSFPGFEIAGIGPRDTAFDEAVGGKLYGIADLQLSVPNYLPEQYGIRTALFTYFGTLGQVDASTKALSATVRDDLALRASAGVSVFWTSPLGPIRIDLSQVLAKAPYDRTEAFRFSTNTQF